MTATSARQLADFCADTRFEDLPPEMVTRTKQHMLDTFGANFVEAQGPTS